MRRLTHSSLPANSSIGQLSISPWLNSPSQLSTPKLSHPAAQLRPPQNWCLCRGAYEDRASVIESGTQSNSRSASPKADGRKVRSHLCTPRLMSASATTHAQCQSSLSRPTNSKILDDSPSPLASSPRFLVSPSPREFSLFRPQHLTLPSSCTTRNLNHPHSHRSLPLPPG